MGFLDDVVHKMGGTASDVDILINRTILTLHAFQQTDPNYLKAIGLSPKLLARAGISPSASPPSSTPAPPASVVHPVSAPVSRENSGSMAPPPAPVSRDNSGSMAPPPAPVSRDNSGSMAPPAPVSRQNSGSSAPPATSNPVINFYDLDKQFGQFSNFFNAPFEIQGRVWPTSEHYFQAYKFHPAHPQYVDEIWGIARPRQVFNRAHDLDQFTRADWPQIKEQVMKEALIAKFSTHNDLRELLLSTAPATLVEHTHLDKYWADGGDGSGKNRLGILLMEVRSMLADAKTFPWNTKPPPVFAKCAHCQVKPPTPGMACCSRECTLALTTSTPQLCAECHNKPVSAGFQFCSQSCGSLFNQKYNSGPARASHSPRSPANPHAAQPSSHPQQMCLQCKVKPISPGFQFCSQSCGSQFNQKHNLSPARATNSPPSSTGPHSGHGTSAPLQPQSTSHPPPRSVSPGAQRQAGTSHPPVGAGRGPPPPAANAKLQKLTSSRPNK